MAVVLRFEYDLVPPNVHVTDGLLSMTGIGGTIKTQGLLPQDLRSFGASPENVKTLLM
jgi:hypothetical protein